MSSSVLAKLRCRDRCCRSIVPITKEFSFRNPLWSTDSRWFSNVTSLPEADSSRLAIVILTVLSSPMMRERLVFVSEFARFRRVKHNNI